MESLFVSWGEQIRHMFQEVLIVGKNHVMQRVVVTQEDASIVLRILEGDTITEKRHLMVTGIVVEPEVVGMCPCMFITIAVLMIIRLQRYNFFLRMIRIIQIFFAVALKLSVRVNSSPPELRGS